jgi:HKD family nuclease
VSLSKLPDNFFCLHVPSEYDYLLVSNKKTEIVTKLIEEFEKCAGQKLPVTFSNSFDYKIDNDMYREILFTNVEGKFVA